MSQPRFIHEDIVRVIETGQIGTVKAVREDGGSSYLYDVELRTEAGELITRPEAALTMLKIANEDETGYHIRYVS